MTTQVLATGAIGCLLIYFGFRQLAIIRVYSKEMSWGWELIRTINFVVNLIVGCIFAFCFIFIPASKGIDMDAALFGLIALIFICAWRALLASEDDFF